MLFSRVRLPAFKHIALVFALAFTTVSFAATLPVSLTDGTRHFEVSERAPLGRFNAFKLTELQIAASTSKDSASCTLTDVTLWMPEHRHAMLTKPVWSVEKSGEWLIKGVKLHMPGHWEIQTKWRCDAKEITITASMQV